MVSMDDEQRAYLQEVRAHRAELREAVTAVDDALAGPIQLPHWRERVLVAMAELAHDFRQHRALTEGPRGLYAEVLRSAPHLASTVDRLRGEHDTVSDRIRLVLGVLDTGQPIPDLDGFREEVTALMGRLVRHRQQGSDLVYAAYEWDIGGSD